MSIIFEGYLGIDFESEDNLPKEIIEVFIKQIENKFNYENLYFREEEKDLNIHFDSQIEFEECYEWLESQMQKEYREDKIHNFLIESGFRGDWRVVGEPCAGKIIKNSKEKKVKIYDLDFSLISEAVLIATNNLNFSEGNLIETSYSSSIELMDTVVEKELTRKLIIVGGVFCCLLLFQKENDDGIYEVIFEKAYDDNSVEEFPKSISEVLENHELEYSSCEEEVSPDYYYELIHGVLSNKDKAYLLRGANITLKAESEIKKLIQSNNFSLEDIKTDDHLSDCLTYLGYSNIDVSHKYEHPLWKLSFALKSVLSLEAYGAPIKIITPTKLLGKKSDNWEIEKTLEELIDAKMLNKTSNEYEIKKSNKISLCVEFDGFQSRKILNWFFLDRTNLNLYKVNPKEHSIQNLDESIENSLVLDQEPAKRLDFGTIQFSTCSQILFKLPKDSKKDEIYKKLVSVLKKDGINLNEYKEISISTNDEREEGSYIQFYVYSGSKLSVNLFGTINGNNVDFTGEMNNYYVSS